MSTVIDGSASVTINSGAILGITSNTAVTASGTVVLFTGIPSWVKRVTVMFSGVTRSASANILIQIGSGSVTTTGYVSTANGTNQANATGGFSSTSGFGLRAGTLSALSVTTLVGSNVYVNAMSGKFSTSDAQFGGGDVTLGGSLDRVNITTTNGTDTFTGGTINILYE